MVKKYQIITLAVVFRPRHELMKYPKKIPKSCPSCYSGELFLIRLRQYHVILMGKGYELRLTVEFLPVGKCTKCTNIILNPTLEEALVELVDNLTQDLVEGREVNLENSNFQSVTAATVN